MDEVDLKISKMTRIEAIVKLAQIEAVVSLAAIKDKKEKTPEEEEVLKTLADFRSRIFTYLYP